MHTKEEMENRIKAINEEMGKIEKDLYPLYEVENPGTPLETLYQQRELERRHQALHEEHVDLYDKIDKLDMEKE